DPKALQVVTRVAEHYARAGTTENFDAVLVAIAKNPAIADAVLAGFAEGWPDKATVTLKPETEQALADVFAKLSPQGQGRLIRLTTTWGSQGFEKYAAELAASFFEIAEDDSKSDEERIAA